jgi:hypothetical protein
VSRRVEACVVCGEPREIFSHGRCSRCLAQQRREAARHGEPVYLRQLNGYMNRIARAAAAIEDGAIPESIIPNNEYLVLRRIMREALERLQAIKKENEIKTQLAVGKNRKGES